MFTVQTSAKLLQLALLAASLLFTRPVLAGPDEEAASEPVVAVEIVFRDNGSTLFLARGLVRPGPWRADSGLPVVGFNASGRVPYQQPGRGVVKQVQRQLQQGRVEPPLVLDRTTWYGARFADGPREGAGDVPKLSLWAEGDLGMSLDLPAPGKPAIVLHASSLFRVERLTAAQAAEFAPLREDRAFWAARVAALREEMMETQRDLLGRDPRALQSAAFLFRDERLMNAVRARLRGWLNPSAEPEEKDGPWFHAVLEIMERVGTADDLALIEELVHRYPAVIERLRYRLPAYARRVGLRHGRRLLLKLLESTEAGSYTREVDPLRLCHPATPRPQRRDDAIVDIADAFELDLKKFGMIRVYERYLELQNRQHSAAEIEEAAREFSYVWIFPTEEARTKGVEQMRRWLEEVGQD